MDEKTRLKKGGGYSCFLQNNQEPKDQQKLKIIIIIYININR